MRFRLAAAGLLFLAAQSCAPAPSGQGSRPAAQVTPFSGGKFEASGVAHVPGTDGVLFVDNSRPGEVFWMRLDRAGRQAGDVVAVSLGVEVQDPEGVTTDGASFYVVGSQSKAKAGERPGLVRFRFDAARLRAEQVESLSGLKQFLAERVGELRGLGGGKAKEGGMSVEGLAWDPRGGRLLLGLRSPTPGGQALVIPLKPRDPRGALSHDNLEVGEAIRLPLGGLGIRGIEYDAPAGAYRLIAGAPEDQGKTDFGLWEWDGAEGRPGLRETRKFDRDLKPEGVTRATAGGREFILIVFDSGGYSVTD
jgi:hypothetical protein